MAASQPFGVSCKGGLNTNLNQLEMLAQPGLATKLVNFEVDPDGGYRRINGYSPFGETRPNGASPSLGIFVYGDGLLFCSGTGIFFTLDGTTWLQVNRNGLHSQTYTYAQFVALAVVPRVNQQQVVFSLYEGNDEYGRVLIVDGANIPFTFEMFGTGVLSTRTFHVHSFGVSNDETPSIGVIHKDHFVVAGAPTAKNTVFYSASYLPENFTGTGAGSIQITDQVIGLKSFRDDLIVFCQNSIFKIVNMSDPASIAVLPITRNVGCLSHHSIQEIGGDLIFLSPDGLRTVAGTSRIGDVELGSVSRQIQSIISEIAQSINTFVISSAVLRNKSQYRLYYAPQTGQETAAKGIIGTLTMNGFEWSETLGIAAPAFSSGFDHQGVEKAYHGDNEGYVYTHDSGNSFYANGVPFNISAQYATPNYDFGDIGTRKTLQYIKISTTPEGEVQPTLRVRYDYEDTDIPQPPDYVLDAIPLPAFFGTSKFGSAIFGASNDPMLRQAIQGSGHSCSFRISSVDQNAPYAINGLYINYVPAGRR